MNFEEIFQIRNEKENKRILVFKMYCKKWCKQKTTQHKNGLAVFEFWISNIMYILLTYNKPFSQPEKWKRQQTKNH